MEEVQRLQVMIEQQQRQIAAQQIVIQNGFHMNPVPDHVARSAWNNLCEDLYFNELKYYQEEFEVDNAEEIECHMLQDSHYKCMRVLDEYFHLQAVEQIAQIARETFNQHVDAETCEDSICEKRT